MHIAIVIRVLGVLLSVFSLTLLPPLALSFIYADGAHEAFIEGFLLILGIGLLIWLPVNKQRGELKVRDGFLVVALFWSVLSLAGSLPLMLAEHPHLSFTDAVFETASGLTTTGATVIVGLDKLPQSILYYRQQLQWFGGMGVIVLAVAILPMLGIGGMQLYKAETPGPVKDSKLTPRIHETAKALWIIYVLLTAACALAYWLAGMSWFDAVGHSFATLANGGYSTHDASMGYFNSSLINYITVVFMLAGGANFALHFLAWRNKSLSGYWRDSEFKFYLLVVVAAAGSVALGLSHFGVYEHWWQSLEHGLFQVVSLMTTSGYTTANFAAWPGVLAMIVLLVAFVGGCAGSTSGGIKVVRILLLIKQGMREIRMLIHPNAQIPVRLGGKTVPPRVVDAVWGFFGLYMASFFAMYLAIAADGVDLMTAFSAVVACINNAGPGLGGVASNYADLNDTATWILTFAMLLGRLEVFTLLVLFTPDFWRR